MRCRGMGSYLLERNRNWRNGRLGVAMRVGNEGRSRGRVTASGMENGGRTYLGTFQEGHSSKSLHN